MQRSYQASFYSKAVDLMGGPDEALSLLSTPKSSGCSDRGEGGKESTMYNYSVEARWLPQMTKQSTTHSQVTTPHASQMT